MTRWAIRTQRLVFRLQESRTLHRYREAGELLKPRHIDSVWPELKPAAFDLVVAQLPVDRAMRRQRSRRGRTTIARDVHFLQ
jgi:hypothetical protein